MPVIDKTDRHILLRNTNIIQTHSKVYLPDVGLLKHKTYLRPITARKPPLLATCYLLEPSPDSKIRQDMAIFRLTHQTES